MSGWGSGDEVSSRNAAVVPHAPSQKPSLPGRNKDSEKVVSISENRGSHEAEGEE